MRVLPRGSILKKLITPFVLCLGNVSIPIAMVTFSVQNQDIPKAYTTFWLPSLPLLFFVLSLAAGMFLLIKEWFKHRYEFLESEQYLILFSIAVYLSAWFGIANYTVYAINPTAFTVDREMQQQLVDKQEREWQQYLVDSRRIVANCDRVITELQRQPDEITWMRLSPDTYITPLTGTDLSIEYHLPIDWKDHMETGGVDSITAKVGTEVLVTTSLPGIRGLELAEGIDKPRKIPRSVVVAAIQEKKRREIDDWVNPLESGIPRRPVPLSLFLYQAVMDTVGASPRYFNPAAFSTRLIAFIYAVCKFVFFGMVVAALMKQLKPQKDVGTKAASA